MNDNDDPWKRLVDAAKTAPLDDPESPPTVSVNSLRDSVQGLLLALTWRKWSLIAAVLAGFFFLGFYFFFREEPLAEEPIIPTDPPAAPRIP